MRYCLGAINNVLYFFAEICFIFKILQMKNFYLFSHQCATAKMLISLKKQQNVDFMIMRKLNNVDFMSKINKMLIIS